jgi:hypothetical protein
LIACAANFGVAMLMKMSGLAPLICTTWESTVGALTSKGTSATMIFDLSAPKASLKPVR